MCAQGQIIAWSEKGMVTLSAGDVLCSKAGTKRVTMAVTDAIGITVHKTNKTDLDKIENYCLVGKGHGYFERWGCVVQQVGDKTGDYGGHGCNWHHGTQD